MDGYSRGELVWLLSLDERDAQGFGGNAGALDESAPRSALGRAIAGAPGHQRTDSDDAPVPVLARWSEVHAAKRRIENGKRERVSMFVRLRAAGYTEDEIALAYGVSQATVSRRFKATITELLDVLGEAAPLAGALSVRSACMKCADHPRARVRDKTRRLVRGKWKLVEVERQASLCLQCLPPDRRYAALLADANAAVNGDGGDVPR